MREHMLHVRLNGQEYDRLKAHADKNGVSMSEVLRDYIKSLPAPKPKREAR